MQTVTARKPLLVVQAKIHAPSTPSRLARQIKTAPFVQEAPAKLQSPPLRAMDEPSSSGSLDQTSFLTSYLRRLDLADEMRSELCEVMRMLSAKAAIDAEKRNGEAEKRYGEAEKRFSKKVIEMTEIQLQSMEVAALAKERFFELAELRHGLIIWEELKKIQDLAPVARNVNGPRKQPRPSQRSKWQSVFEEIQQSSTHRAKRFMACCKRAKLPKSPEKLADRIVRILGLHDLNYHRLLQADEMRRIGGIPLIESSMTPMEDCRLLKCLFTYQSYPARVLTREEALNLLIVSEQKLTKDLEKSDAGKPSA